MWGIIYIRLIKCVNFTFLLILVEGSAAERFEETAYFELGSSVIVEA